MADWLQGRKIMVEALGGTMPLTSWQPGSQAHGAECQEDIYPPQAYPSDQPPTGPHLLTAYLAMGISGPIH